MKKRNISFIALLVVTIMFLVTTGCGVRINGKEYELYKSSQSHKNNNIFNDFGEETSDDQLVSQDNVDGEKLKVSTNAGNIDIRKANDSDVTVKAKKKVRGVSSGTKKTILENMIVTLEKNGNSTEVVVKTKDGKDFWDWQKKNYKAYQITLNLDVSLPDKIKELDASTGAGNIEVEGAAEKITADTGAGNININDMNAEYDISTGAGNINIEGSAKGDCKVSTGAGNIDFNGSVEELDKFDASTGMGNVDIKLPGETKMTLEAGTGVGVLSGNFIKTSGNDKFHFKGDINGGGPTVKLSTGVGNISVKED